MLKDPIWKLIIAYCVGVAVILVLAYLFSSCNVLKKSSSVSKDSTSVVKVDTGRVVKNEVNKTDSMAWWREIINFSRDTTIVNPVTNVYPTSYIREGGVREITTKEINYDSLWNNKMDSLVTKLQTVDKSKSVKTPGVWLMWLAIGISLITLLSRFLTIKK